MAWLPGETGDFDPPGSGRLCAGLALSGGLKAPSPACCWVPIWLAACVVGVCDQGSFSSCRGLLGFGRGAIGAEFWDAELLAD